LEARQLVKLSAVVRPIQGTFLSIKDEVIAVQVFGMNLQLTFEGPQSRRIWPVAADRPSGSGGRLNAGTGGRGVGNPLLPPGCRSEQAARQERGQCRSFHRRVSVAFR